MTPHFTIAEFEASQIAARRGLDNRVPEALMPNARQTLEMMERIRAALTKEAGRPIPIIISSGYRSPAVNAAVGGSTSSDHLKAMAVDWTAPAFGSPYEVATFLAGQVSELIIGQIIHEFGAWIHTSTQLPSKAFNRIITRNYSGTKVGIVAA